MIRERILIPSLLTLTALGLGACKETGEHESAKHEAHEGHEADEEPELHEGKLPTKPAVSLSAAITTAQKSLPDGRFLQAVIENEGGKQVCKILLVSGDGQRQVEVDAANGQLLSSEQAPLEPEAKELLDELGNGAKLISVGVVQAIDAALAKVPGAWALYASLSSDGGKPVYAVLMLAGKTAKVAQVSAADGNVQRVSDWTAEAMEGEEAPEAKPK